MLRIECPVAQKQVSSGVFVDYICNSEVDIAVITETWLKSVDAAIKTAATLTGFRLLDHPCLDRPGGSTGVLVRDSLVAKQASEGILNSFEYSEWIITSGLVRLRLVAIYRPPYSPNHPVIASMFLTEFAEFLESIVMSTEPLIMAGDFNIHVSVPSDNDTV